MTDDVPNDRAATEEAARTGEFPNATGEPRDDSNLVSGGSAGADDVALEGEDAARVDVDDDRPSASGGSGRGAVGTPEQRAEDLDDATPPGLGVADDEPAGQPDR